MIDNKQLEALLDDVNLMMLPGTLEDCFEAHREALLQEACEPYSEDRLLWFLDEMKKLRGETDEQVGFNDIFDPFLGVPHGTERLPVGNVVTVPPVPTTILAEAPAVSPLAALADRETTYLWRRLERYEDEEIAGLCKIATAGYVDTDAMTGSREAMVRYIAVNGSSRIKDFLAANIAILRSVLPRQVQFPDAVSSRRKSLLEYIPTRPEVFEVTPRPPEYFLECYTEDEIRAITLDVRTLALSPRFRHLGLCRKCLNRLIYWQKQYASFQQMVSSGITENIDA